LYLLTLTLLIAITGYIFTNTRLDVLVRVCRTAVVTAMFFINVASVILWDEEHYCKESSVEFILKLMYLSVRSFRDVQIDSRLSSRFDFTVHSLYLSNDSFVPSTYCVCYFRVRTFFVALMHTPQLVFSLANFILLSTPRCMHINIDEFDPIKACALLRLTTIYLLKVFQNGSLICIL